MKSIRPMQARRWNSSGVAALEFGLMAPFWAVFAVLSLDFSEAYYLKMKLATATNAAAQYAFLNAQLVSAATVTSFLANVVTVAQTMANLTTTPTVTALFNNASTNANGANYYCVSGPSPLIFTSTGTASTSCGGSVTSGKYVTITITGSVATFFAADPIFGSTISASDQAVVRFE